MSVWTWAKSYHKDGDHLVLRETPLWSLIVEHIGVPLIRFGVTYRIGNSLIRWADRSSSEIHVLPLPEELSDASWREEEGASDD